MPKAAPLPLRPGDRAALERLSAQPEHWRARIVLLAAEGRSNAEIGRTLDTTSATVRLWRRHYTESGLEPLLEIVRPARLRERAIAHPSFARGLDCPGCGSAMEVHGERFVPGRYASVEVSYRCPACGLDEYRDEVPPRHVILASSDPLTRAAATTPRPTMPDVTVTDHPAVVRVTTALTHSGVTGRVVALDDHARTAAQAAEQLGVTVAQIANSLVFAVPDDTAPGGKRALLVLTSGGHRVDTAKVAAAIGAPRLDRATPDFVRERTGFAIGGVAPVGHLTPIQTLVDLDLAHHERVWAAAGHPRTVFPTTFDELVAITGGTPSEVA